MCYYAPNLDDEVDWAIEEINGARFRKVQNPRVGNERLVWRKKSNTSNSIPTHDAKTTEDDIRIDQIWIYPIKGMRGIQLSHAKLDEQGFQFDRRFMLVRNNRLCSQTGMPALALVEVSIPQNGTLTLRAPGMDDFTLHIRQDSESPPVDVFLYKSVKYPAPFQATDQGDEIAAWFNEYLNRGKCRLVKIREDDYSRYTDGIYTPIEFQGISKVGFASDFPFLICSNFHLDELNQKIVTHGGNRIDIRRFRPSLVLSGLSERKSEDDIVSFDLRRRDGSVIGPFHVVKPCPRCSVPQVDPDRGTRTRHDVEPQRSLRTYRTGRDLGYRGKAGEKWGEKVFFGMFALHMASTFDEVVSVGDRLVNVVWK